MVNVLTAFEVNDFTQGQWLHFCRTGYWEFLRIAGQCQPCTILPPTPGTICSLQPPRPVLSGELEGGASGPGLGTPAGLFGAWTEPEC